VCVSTWLLVHFLLVPARALGEMYEFMIIVSVFNLFLHLFLLQSFYVLTLVMLGSMLSLLCMLASVVICSSFSACMYVM